MIGIGKQAKARQIGTPGLGDQPRGPNRIIAAPASTTAPPIASQRSGMGTLDCPKPEQRGRDIDAAISGVGAAGFVSRQLRQQPGKQRENAKPRQQPQSHTGEPPTRTKSQETRQLQERGNGKEEREG